MPLALLIVGTLLIVVAFQNTIGDLARAIGADVPGYFKWLVAIVAILALGYLPSMRTPSRILLTLVVLVVLLTNYRQILAGFKTFAASSGTAQGATPPNPATAFASSPNAPLPSPAAVGGSSSVAPATASSPAAIAGNVAGGMTGGGAGGLAQVLQGGAASVANPATILNLADPAGFASAIGSSIGFGGFL